MMKRLFLVFIYFSLTISFLSAKDYYASAYKIVGDSVTLNTKSIQKLIDNVSRKGGGRIVFTQGCFLTGQITLKSGVELHFEKDATLLGSTSPYDYSVVHANENKERLDNAHLGLIVSDKAQKIAITGEGTIDGQGLQLALNADSLHHTGELADAHYNTRRQRPSELVRPTLFYFHASDSIKIEGVHLRNSASWGLSFNHCRNLIINNVEIYNRAYWNNDGIDLTDCQRVVVSNTKVNSADDGICLKSYDKDSGNDSISISNCEIRSSASAVKFGTGSYGGFRHVGIRHIRVFDTFRSAIAIESVDGATIEDVNVDDIQAFNTGNAIFIRLGQRAGDRKGSIRRVTISNLTAQIPFGRPDANYDLRGPEVDYFHNIHPSSICGIPDNDIEDVTLKNITITYPGRATKGMAYMPLWRVSDVPEKIKDYPEFTMFGELPSWGFYVRHVKGLKMSNINLSLADSDFRPAFVFDDVHDLKLENISLPLGLKDQYFYHDCK